MSLIRKLRPFEPAPPPDPNAPPTGESLQRLFLLHGDPLLSLTEVLHLIGVTILHFFDCMASDPELRRLYELRTTAAHELLLDQQRLAALTPVENDDDDTDTEAPGRKTPSLDPKAARDYASMLRAITAYNRAVKANALVQTKLDAIEARKPPSLEDTIPPLVYERMMCAADEAYREHDRIELLKIDPFDGQYPPANPLYRNLPPGTIVDDDEPPKPPREPVTRDFSRFPPDPPAPERRG